MLQGALNHDDGRHHRHVSTPNHRREQLLAGWKLGATGHDPAETGSHEDNDGTTTTTRGGDEPNETKAQETSPTSLGPSVSFLFVSFHIFVIY
jgi:hypothetical protein